ncbi:Branched-chain amino acid uptake carrier braB (fragment) [Capnocytophaga canimorsus]
MNSPKRRIINTTTIGFALFAMFFGAGNLILPPYIGLTSGSQWFAALLGFFVTAILAPFLGLLMVIRTGTSFVDLGKRVHPQVISVIAF